LAQKKERLLSNKLQKLKDQLSVEKEKTAKLQYQLKKNLEISKRFSNLYKDAVNDTTKNVSKDDKEFLKVVESEKKRLTNLSAQNVNKSKNKADDLIKDESIKQVVATKHSDSVNSTVEISTSNQVSQIVSTINKTSYNPLKRRSFPSNKVYIDLDDNGAQNSVKIQNKINQLVSEKDVPKTRFTKALEKEEKVRKNSVRSVVVRKGDTLWSIAKRAYGSGFKYRKILKANPSIRKKNIVRLHVGQVIRVPR